MKYPLIALTAMLLVGCNSTQNTTSSQNQQALVQNAQSNQATKIKEAVSASEDNVLYVLADVPYSNPNIIAENIKNECHQLGLQFSNSLVKYANKHRVNVKQVEGELPKTGKVLQLSIDNVYSGGNAFIGHRKSASVTAKLMVDGKLIDSTTKTRDSAGGFFGGFKGSCSVLAHTVNTLGNDVAKWAKGNKHLL